MRKLKNTLQKNPSSKEFARVTGPSLRKLREIMRKNRSKRRMQRVWEAKRNPDKFETDYETCWMCWCDLSGKGLVEWRKEPFSELKDHSPICPLCFYPHWKGRVWYPFRYLRDYIGNPSSRFEINKKKK